MSTVSTKQVSLTSNDGTKTVNLTVDNSGTLQRDSVGVPRMQLMTAKSATGTSVDFTDIPSWAKRITVMFHAVSTNGSSPIQIQIGSGAIVGSGYSSHTTSIEGTAVGTSVSGTGILVDAGGSPSMVRFGRCVLENMAQFTYTATTLSGVSGGVGARINSGGAGIPIISGTLDRIRITTVNDTDTFDSGTINILVEGY